MADIKAQLRSYIQDNFVLGAVTKPLGNADSFMDRAILDSTGFLELVTYLEESFGMVVTDEEMIPENLDSIDSLAAFVERKQRSSGTRNTA
jgi:acyl carrier protein